MQNIINMKCSSYDIREGTKHAIISYHSLRCLFVLFLLVLLKLFIILIMLPAFLALGVYAFCMLFSSFTFTELWKPFSSVFIAFLLSLSFLLAVCKSAERGKESKLNACFILVLLRLPFLLLCLPSSLSLATDGIISLWESARIRALVLLLLLLSKALLCLFLLFSILSLCLLLLSFGFLIVNALWYGCTLMTSLLLALRECRLELTNFISHSSYLNEQ